jgi:acyl-CoA thioesterase FadM
VVSIEVRYSDADASRQVSAAQYLRYAEENRAVMLRDLMTGPGAGTVNASFVVVEVAARIIGRIPVPSRLTIAANVTSISESAIHISYVLDSQGTAVANIAEVLVPVDNEGRPRVLSSAEREYVGQFVDADIDTPAVTNPGWPSPDASAKDE